MDIGFMCGIFGFVANSDSGLDGIASRRMVIDLFHRSEPRGKDASGLVLVSGGVAETFKKPLPPDRLLSDKDFKTFLSDKVEDACGRPTGPLSGPMAAIGHCRLVTSGTEVIHENNQPIIVNGVVGIHNGIITNEMDLWHRHEGLAKKFNIDSEIIFQLISEYRKDGHSIAQATGKCFEELEGTAAVAYFLQESNQLVLATNYGSLYVTQGNGVTVFASEQYILDCFLDTNKDLLASCGPVERVGADAGRLIDLGTAVCTTFHLSGNSPKADPPVNGASFNIAKILDRHSTAPEIERCIKCILPITYPFISFDKDGVCNYCNDFVEPDLFGEDALLAELDKHRSKDGSPDCMVGFSGGRDSSYGLHILKNKYQMNPVAFSYDWGMVTDIARRNQARICSQLKVEHIFRAADIPTKRRNMRKNIQAWLRRPHLGMVTLFMAGDKFFFSIARQLRRQMKIPLVIHCGGNELERTDFKAGFANLKEGAHGNRFYAFPVYHKVKIGMFYISQYLLNPSYINESFYDSAMSFLATFVAKDDFMYLFQYIPWDENNINDTLLNDYNWEKASYTDNTWRIGDGYTTFINYIFYTVAGFSEFDTFRSQQIRAGLLDRDTAMALAAKDNQFDMPTLLEFMGQVGLNLEETLTKIDEIPKLY